MARHLGFYPPPNSLAQHLSILLPRLEINCVVDAGAHWGSFGQMLRAIGYKGEIVSFEPVAASYERLAELARRDSRWRTYQLALGATAGWQSINIPNSTKLASFLTANAYSMDRFGESAHTAQSQVVEVRPLANVLDELGISAAEPRIFLKTDTQGYDLQVIEGARTRLDLIAALQTEVSVKPIYHNLPTFQEALTFLNGLGFETTALFPVTRDVDELRVIEFDCVMRRAR